MVITEIRPLKNGRYGLFTGEEFLFPVDGDTLAESGLHAGEPVDELRLDEIRRASEFRKAREKAYLFLSYRDHSSEELRRKLLRHSDEESAQGVVDKMEEMGLVNDEAYSKKLAQLLLEGKGYGRGRALSELLRKGIDRELAEEAVGEFDLDSRARASALLRKKYPRGIEGEAGRRKAAAMLSRNGYAWEDIRAALNDYSMEDPNAD